MYYVASSLGRLGEALHQDSASPTWKALRQFLSEVVFELRQFEDFSFPEALVQGQKH